MISSSARTADTGYTPPLRALPSTLFSTHRCAKLYFPRKLRTSLEVCSPSVRLLARCPVHALAWRQVRPRTLHRKKRTHEERMFPWFRSRAPILHKTTLNRYTSTPTKQARQAKTRASGTETGRGTRRKPRPGFHPTTVVSNKTLSRGEAEAGWRGRKGAQGTSVTATVGSSTLSPGCRA